MAFRGGTVPDLHRVPSPCSEAGAYHRPVPSDARRFAPVVAWAAVIFAFSSIPSLGTGLGGWDLLLRKLAHVTEYAILGALLYRALRRPWPAFGIAVAYAGTDEAHQHFVRGRHASPVDVAIDAAGVAIGMLVWRRLSA